MIEIEQENGEGERKGETEARRYVGGVRRCPVVCVSAGGCEFVGVGTASAAPPPPRDSSPLPGARSVCAGMGNFISLCPVVAVG